MAERDNKFTEKQIRGIDLIVKSVKKKYPFIIGWEFNKDFEKYVVHLYINLIVDFDEVAKFYKDDIHLVYKDRRIPLISSLLLTFLESNNFLGFDNPKRQEFFEYNYNETKKLTNLVSQLYKTLPEEFLIYYDYESWNNEIKKYEVDLSVSEFFDVTAV